MTLRNRWSTSQIRAARRVILAPLLQQMGYRLQPLDDENGEVHGLPRPVIIKEHYWSSPQNRSGGNAIDLLMQVIGMSFNEAMEKLEEFRQP